MFAHTYRHLFPFSGPLCGGGKVHWSEKPCLISKHLQAKNPAPSFLSGGFDSDDDDDQNDSTHQSNDI